MTENNKRLVGRTIKEVRPMTVNEQVAEGWSGRGLSRPRIPTLAIVLDDGTVICAESGMRAHRGLGQVSIEEEK